MSTTIITQFPPEVKARYDRLLLGYEEDCSKIKNFFLKKWDKKEEDSKLQKQINRFKGMFWNKKKDSMLKEYSNDLQKLTDRIKATIELLNSHSKILEELGYAFLDKTAFHHSLDLQTVIQRGGQILEDNSKFLVVKGLKKIEEKIKKKKKHTKSIKRKK